MPVPSYLPTAHAGCGIIPYQILVNGEDCPDLMVNPVDQNQKELEWLYSMVSHFALGYSSSKMELFSTGKMHFHSFPMK